MPCLRQTSVADNPAACSFSTLMICSSVNLLLRMSVSSKERTLPKTGGSYGEQVTLHLSFGQPQYNASSSYRISCSYVGAAVACRSTLAKLRSLAPLAGV